MKRVVGNNMKRVVGNNMKKGCGKYYEIGNKIKGQKNDIKPFCETYETLRESKICSLFSTAKFALYFAQPLGLPRQQPNTASDRGPIWTKKSNILCASTVSIMFQWNTRLCIPILCAVRSNPQSPVLSRESNPIYATSLGAILCPAFGHVLVLI